MIFAFKIIVSVSFCYFGFNGLMKSNGKKFAYGVILLLGISTFLESFLNTSINKEAKTIVNLDCNLISKIKISPSKKTSIDRSLSESIYVISDRSSIDLLCSALANAELTYTGAIKGADWYAFIEIIYDNDKIDFLVRSKNDLARIRVYANGEFGQLLDILRCNELSYILPELVQSESPI